MYMEKTFDFLKNRTKVNFVSTINGDKPSCRPFGDPVLFNNHIYALTHASQLTSQNDSNGFAQSPKFLIASISRA